jgi:integrase/recombinase XerD
MKQKVNLIGPLLQNFFVDFLVNQRRVSTQTLASYRDAFRLLLQFVREQKKIEPSAVRVGDLNVELILSFLEHLERDRENSIRSRNQRLAAIRAFFRLIALRDPESVSQAAQVLAIPFKRTDRRVIKALSREEVEAILSVPDLTQWNGRRDHALLLTLYNSGARVSEVISLRCSQVHFGTSTFLQLHGKGRKERIVPLWPKTANILKAWFRELEGNEDSLAFPSVRGRPMTRNGVNYILQQAIASATEKQASLRDKRISPHTMRHYVSCRTMSRKTCPESRDPLQERLWLGRAFNFTRHSLNPFGASMRVDVPGIGWAVPMTCIARISGLIGD